MSKFFYLAKVLVLPSWVLSCVNQLVWPFLWGSKIETVSRNTCFLLPASGRLNVSSLELKCMLHRISTWFLVFHVYSYQLNIRCSLHKSLSLDSLAHGFSLTSYDIFENVQSFGARTPDT